MSLHLSENKVDQQPGNQLAGVLGDELGWQGSSSSSRGSNEVACVQERLKVAASALLEEGRRETSRRAPPQALTAPRGIRGLFSRGSHAAYEKMDVDSLPAGTVIINIYDVGDEELVQKVNRYATLNDRVLFGGVYHAGVEIFGREWGYGGSEEEGITGVFDCPPRCNCQHTYRATVDLGLSPLSEEEVLAAVRQLSCSPTWEGCNYDLLHNNCLHFANALCAELQVRNIPGWLNRFDRIGVKLQWLGDHAVDGYERTQQLARGISTDLATMGTAARREAPKIAEAAQIGVQSLSASLSRWGQGLFAAASRAVGDDSKSKEKRREARTNNGESKSDLRSSLRNRGGVRRVAQPNAPSETMVKADGTDAKCSKADIDAFLLLDAPDESTGDDDRAKEQH